MAVRIAGQAGQEEAGRTHPVEAVLHRHPVEAVRALVLHTHHLDTGSAEEEGHYARTPVEPDKQGPSRNTLVAEQEEEVERRMRVVEGIVDYSLGTTCLI